MAKVKGIVKWEGTIGDVTMYHCMFGHLAKEKGGPSREMAKYDKRFERSRENCSEFGEASKAAKLLRDSMGVKVKKLNDHAVTGRTNKLMGELGKLDTISGRGQRKAVNGLNTALGKQIMKGFNVRENAKLEALFKKELKVNNSAKTISINQLVPAADLKAPRSATHVRIKGGYTKLDLNTARFETNESADVILDVKSNTSANVVLQMSGATLSAGYDLYFVCLEFLQEVNGDYYDLENKRFNCLNVVELI